MPAPPAVKLITPELKMEPAKVPATPPDWVVVSPNAGMSATTPLVTSTPLPMAGIPSPWSQLSENENADPEVFISYVPAFIVAAAVADPVVKPPNTSLFPVPTFILFPETEYELPTRSETVAAPCTSREMLELSEWVRSARADGALNIINNGISFHI